jgi:tetratricopeptide (TPR) repeat protein
MEAILAIARKGGFEHLPLIELYQLIFQLLCSPDNEQLHDEFEKALERYKSLIPMETMCNLSAYQRHFWVRYYIKSGLPFYRQKLFDLYKEHFEEGYFYIDGSINVTSLRMLVVFALKLGQFDWVKQVLDQHPPERICGTRYPAEAYNLNLAEYYFYKKEYPQAVDKLQYRLFENPHLSILVDVLLIKIYVETEDELLESRMKALEQKVRRIKLSSDSKIRYTNFLKKLDKIIRHFWQKKSSPYEKMTRELKSISQIIEREWLLEKLEKRAK